MRRAAIAVMTAMLGLALVGCDTDCPAVGFINTVSVDSGAVDGVTELQFCVGDECSPRAAEALPTGSDSTLFGVDQDGDEWTLRLDMRTPESVIIRLFASDGALLRESEHAIDWTPPTGQCGGASTAPPIVLVP